MNVTRRSRKAKRRTAAATVEFAICLPVLITLTLGTMDMCNVIFLRETATLAAYEGARRGVGRGRTSEDVTSRIVDFLNDRNIQFDNAQVVTFSSPTFDDAATLENVTTTVSLPYAGNTIIPTQLFGDLTVRASVTLRKEYQNLN